MALQASELRIGNFVLYGTKGPLIIGEVTQLYKSEGGSIDYHYPLSWGKPIPLTPEILERCGFVRDGDDYCTDKNEPLFSFYEDEGQLFHIWDAAFTKAPCSYLHQLQNLYFALTGNELTYTP